MSAVTETTFESVHTIERLHDFADIKRHVRRPLIGIAAAAYLGKAQLDAWLRLTVLPPDLPRLLMMRLIDSTQQQQAGLVWLLLPLIVLNPEAKGESSAGRLLSFLPSQPGSNAYSWTCQR